MERWGADGNGDEQDEYTYHSWELGITAVGTRLTVTTETSDFGEVKTELILQPVDGIA